MMDCPNCGANSKFENNTCEYCGSYFKQDEQKTKPRRKTIITNDENTISHSSSFFNLTINGNGGDTFTMDGTGDGNVICNMDGKDFVIKDDTGDSITITSNGGFVLHDADGDSQAIAGARGETYSPNINVKNIIVGADGAVKNFSSTTIEYSSKNWAVAFLLALLGFIGLAGLHRIYVGKVFTGILYFLTLGFFFAGTIMDVMSLNMDQFTDKDGKML